MARQNIQSSKAGRNKRCLLLKNDCSIILSAHFCKYAKMGNIHWYRDVAIIKVELPNDKYSTSDLIENEHRQKENLKSIIKFPLRTYTSSILGKITKRAVENFKTYRGVYKVQIVGVFNF